MNRFAFAASFAIGLAAAGLAQEGVPPPPGLVPERVWPAPTAADWQKPVVIQWQRTWPDAVQLARETKRPILVCVNMDGEIASEHYAGVRYRDPAIGALYEPYVCVIASVYRHNPRDYDQEGRRIPCPRFGCVTCGEHIALEPLVFDKFLDGKRIAPRHIMVELDGQKTYDVFYTWDTESVFATIDQGIKQRTIQALPVVRGDRSLLERVQSVDSRDRAEVEDAFRSGDAARRRALLDAALQLGAAAPVELLRLAAQGLDANLAGAARQGMLRAEDPGMVDLLADTLRAPLASGERQQLVEALGRFANRSSKARTFANAHRGFAADRGTLDTGRWQQALAGGDYAAQVRATDPAELGAASDQAAGQRPTDPAPRLAAAEASLLQALQLPRQGHRQQQAFRRMLLEDAERSAAAAVTLGGSGWQLDAVSAVVAAELGRTAAAYEQAIAAAAALPPEAPGPLAVACLALFAEARQEAIVAAVREQRDFPPQWTTDVHAAYAVLGKHPLGQDRHVAHHFDFLDFFGTPEAGAVLDAGLQRFPASAPLHERLRQRLLQTGGPEALLGDYARRTAAADAPPALHWFAGYAALCAAEAHRRQRAEGPARAAYQHGLRCFAAYRERSSATDGEHYVAMAHAGLARLALEAGDLEAAWRALEQAFTAAPLAAASLDGLGHTAVQTADMLRARAEAAAQPHLVQQIDAALAGLPAEALAPPEYERGQPNPRPNRRRG
ncbi:MAG: hypothetical protein JNK49_13600 [Planctomycetes bacterium]|nr:hypothetical protein [Planctomycetota bacterium]